MRFLTYVPLLGILVINLAACGPDKNLNGQSEKIDEAEFQNTNRDDSESGANRIINLQSTPLVPEDDPALLPFDKTEVLDEVVQTVGDDGTLTFDVGNRFVRPLSVKIGCDDKLFQSHGDPVTVIANAGCSEDVQTEESR